MIIKVALLTIVLLFLWFFPSIYTLFYYYRKDGKLTSKAHSEAEDVFGIVFNVHCVIGLFVFVSFAIIKGLGW